MLRGKRVCGGVLFDGWAAIGPDRFKKMNEGSDGGLAEVIDHRTIEIASSAITAKRAPLIPLIAR